MQPWQNLTGVNLLATSGINTSQLHKGSNTSVPLREVMMEGVV